MTGEFSLSDGKELVKLARKSVSYSCAAGARLMETTEKKRLMGKRGCFVTLHTFPEKELRGCIGFPYPIKSLWNAVIDAAREAAFSDPRFPRLQASELNQVIFEVSVLTKPEEISGSGQEMIDAVEVGKDGLIVKKGERSGLLLPIVPVNYKWDSETLLKQTCVKACLPEFAWRSADTQVFKFRSQVFEESSPSGEIKEVDLEELVKK